VARLSWELAPQHDDAPSAQGAVLTPTKPWSRMRHRRSLKKVARRPAIVQKFHVLFI
jgi:hypothetical protein